MSPPTPMSMFIALPENEATHIDISGTLDSSFFGGFGTIPVACDEAGALAKAERAGYHNSAYILRLTPTPDQWMRIFLDGKFVSTWWLPEDGYRLECATVDIRQWEVEWIAFSRLRCEAGG